MNAFWIFVGIAVLQAIVGAIAKQADARKKREAKALREAQRGSSAAPPAAPTTAKVASSPPTAAPPAETAAAQMIASVRDAMAGQVSNISGVPTGGQPGKAARPSARSSATDEAVLAERRRRVEALRRRQARAAGRPEPPPPSTPSAKPPPEPVKRVAAKATEPAAAKSPKAASVPTPRTPKPARIAQPRSMAGGTSSRVRRILRDPRSVRDAILVAELLEKPVGLRTSPPGSSG